METPNTDPCRCLEIIRAKLTEHHGLGSEVELKLKTTINHETLTLGRALPALEYTYKAGNKRKNGYMSFGFCPFCGKKNS